jgi:hypothetical protein
MYFSFFFIWNFVWPPNPKYKLEYEQYQSGCRYVSMICVIGMVMLGREARKRDNLFPAQTVLFYTYFLQCREWCSFIEFIPMLQSVSHATCIKTLKVLKASKVLVRVACETDCNIGISKWRATGCYDTILSNSTFGLISWKDRHVNPYLFTIAFELIGRFTKLRK